MNKEEENQKLLSLLSIMNKPELIKMIMELKEELDNKQVTLNQSADLAFREIHDCSGSYSEKEYNEEFKKQTKRFFTLLTELQEELW